METISKNTQESDYHLFETIFEQSVMGIAIRAIDPENPKWLRVNKKFCSMLGYDTEEMLKLTSLDITLPEDLDETIRFNQSLLGKNTPSYSRKKRYLCKDGSIIWVNLWLSALPDINGISTQVISVIQDITENKATEEKLIHNEARLRAFFRNSDTTINIKDTDGRFLLVSRKFEQTFGFSEDEVVGKLPHEIYPKEFADHTRNHDMEVLKQGKLIYQEDVVPGSNPTTTLLASKFPITSESGEINGIGTISVDISDRKLIEEELLTQSQIVTNMEESAILIRAHDKTILYSNPSTERVFGYPPGELAGQPFSILDAPVNKRQKDKSKGLIESVNASGKWHGECRYMKKDGSEFWCSVNITSFHHTVYGDVWVSINSDTTERRQIEEKLNFQARHDSLTGLINRHEFEIRVNHSLGQLEADDAGHAMCFLDLDQFKVINDTCGHPAGDELLRQVGNLLQSTVRKGDTLARLGGDEFGLLMEHCSLDQAQRAANSILSAINDFQFIWDNKTFRIGVSIGLISIGHSSGKFTELFKQADLACYLAKDKGRNRIHSYHPEDAETASRESEMHWVEKINQALNENRFCLFAQPIVAFDGESSHHYELLIRMLDDQGNIIPPGAFLPAAERYNLMEKLDTWVISNACQILAENPGFVERVNFISINLSGASITNYLFQQNILSILQNATLPPEKLCFEVTETVAISNLEVATSFISKLREIGCQFALDDFGSGLSSFGYLKNLKVDFLKIDGMFVKDIVDDPIDRAMVKSINEIGQVMGMKTIAEFVENDTIRSELEKIGVNYGQGYGLGKPTPLQEQIEIDDTQDYPTAKIIPLKGKKGTDLFS
ncbi:MAG: EAL domain-containing protein [Pseudomonadota bacterium]